MTNDDIKYLENRLAKLNATKKPPPPPKSDPDFTVLIDCCINHIQNNLRIDESAIYEIALECVYGEEIWEFLNQ